MYMYVECTKAMHIRSCTHIRSDQASSFNVGCLQFCGGNNNNHDFGCSNMTLPHLHADCSLLLYLYLHILVHDTSAFQSITTVFHIAVVSSWLHGVRSTLKVSMEQNIQCLTNKLYIDRSFCHLLLYYSLTLSGHAVKRSNYTVKCLSVCLFVCLSDMLLD